MKRFPIIAVLTVCMLFVVVGCCERAPTSNTPSQRFERAKQSTPELIAFVRRMPKGADLHNHVSGSVYSEFALDRAEKKELGFNIKTNRFTADRENKNDVISIEELKTNPVYLAQFRNSASMRGWYPNTTSGHDHFFSTFYHVWVHRDFRDEMLVEVIERSRYQNVQYLELMVLGAPPAIYDRFRDTVKDIEPGNLEKLYEAVEPLMKDPEIQASIRRYHNDCDAHLMEMMGLDFPVTGNKGDIVVRYIAVLYRLEGANAFFARTAASILAINTDERVVGLNLVAPEDAPLSREYFETHMEILDFLWKRTGKPKFTLHAGELALRDSPVEAMRNRISHTIEKGHALRIGHGVSIAWEDNVTGLLKKMRDEGILVEICLSSNETILGIKGKDHPFDLYRRAGVPVCLNTDDEGVSRSNITMEYIKAIQRYDLTYGEVKDLVRNGIEYSFLPGRSLYEGRDYRRLCPGFEGLRPPGWKPDETTRKLMAENPKLNRQVVLERAFIEFEKPRVIDQ
ncbi:MAG: hypothetical protein GY950_00940 [bacterium]|nr:hypothetical protein [bacterium]